MIILDIWYNAVKSRLFFYLTEIQQRKYCNAFKTVLQLIQDLSWLDIFYINNCTALLFTAFWELFPWLWSSGLQGQVTGWGLDFCNYGRRLRSWNARTSSKTLEQSQIVLDLLEIRWNKIQRQAVWRKFLCASILRLYYSFGLKANATSFTLFLSCLLLCHAVSNNVKKIN